MKERKRTLHRRDEIFAHRWSSGRCGTTVEQIARKTKVLVVQRHAIQLETTKKRSRRKTSLRTGRNFRQRTPILDFCSRSIRRFRVTTSPFLRCTPRRRDARPAKDESSFFSSSVSSRFYQRNQLVKNIDAGDFRVVRVEELRFGHADALNGR